MLPYTRSRTFIESAVFQRDISSTDALGAAQAAEWEEYATSKCRVWWWKGSKSTDKSASEQYARPQATINVTGGDMAVPLGTDVTDEDRVARVLNADGTVFAEGPFRVLSVNPYKDHLELSLERP